MATHIQNLELGRRVSRNQNCESLWAERIGQLGKVLAETEIDGLPAAVIDATPFPGKRIYETSKWIKFFGPSNRKPRSCEYST